MELDELPPDPYAALGLPKDTDLAAIKKAYHKAALRYHPDKLKLLPEHEQTGAAEKFHAIKDAYELVGTEDGRARYDALSRLTELRRQAANLSSAAPRPPMRSQTFAGSTGASFGTRGAKFEVRTPKFHDDDDYTKTSRYNEYDYSKRPTAAPPRTERTRPDRERERDRFEKNRKQREMEERAARRAKYEPEDYSRYEDRDRDRRRPEEPRVGSTERKYEQHHQDASQYIHSRSQPAYVRPSVHRRTSTREVPPSAYRSRASPRETDRAKEKEAADRIILERERQQRERESKRRDYEREAAETKRNLEKDYERERAEAFARLQAVKGETNSSDRRPPTLQTHNSSPPFVGTTSAPASAPPTSASSSSYPAPASHETTERVAPPPSLPRASTMPSVPVANSSAARTREPYSSSKLRETTTAQPDSGYSSPLDSSPNAPTPKSGIPAQAAPAAQPVRVERRYRYPEGNVEVEHDQTKSNYRPEMREPSSSSSRRSDREKTRDRARSPEKASATASKMASLASGRPGTSSGRPGTSSGRPGTSYAGEPARSNPERVPARRTTSDRDSDRERTRDRDAERRARPDRDREADHRSSDDYYKSGLYGERYRSSEARSGHASSGSYSTAPPPPPQHSSSYGPSGYPANSYTRAPPSSDHYYTSGGVSYSRKYDRDDVDFGRGTTRSGRERPRETRDDYHRESRGRERERDRAYPPSGKPGFYRTSTMPVYAS